MSRLLTRDCRSFPHQIALTFSIVFGVIVYRITTAAALSLNKATRSNVRVTVTATAVIINLVVILILDEIYGAVAKWLTKIGTVSPHPVFPRAPLNVVSLCSVLVAVSRIKKKPSPVHSNWENEEVQGLHPGRKPSWNLLDPSSSGTSQ